MTRRLLGCTFIPLAVFLFAGSALAAPPITLDLDATEAPRKIYHARIVMPARPGPMTIYYPKWIPGEHGPTGPVTDLAGLRITAGGAPLPWRRDEVDMYAFHLEVPAGAASIEASLDFLSPPSTAKGFTSAASGTAQMATINWNQVLVYPAGQPARDLSVRASVTLPEGWKLGTALPVASRSGARTGFNPVSLETLVDSPVICGAFFREIPIGPPGGAPHFVEIAADSAAALEVKPETKAAWDRLVTEAWALFGARHYESYRFLLALSDGVAHFGLEHHESSDDRVQERTLLEADLLKAHATLLPHEYVHSWNAKYRRPADLITDDYQKPFRTGLLWVYEGLTQYLGQVLAARSGLWTPEEYRDKLALIAQWATDHAGRTWRPLGDTSVSAQLLFQAREDWTNWRRSTDFYDEGTLIWLEVDTLIREKSQGRRSLDDFCKRFHGAPGGAPRVVPYTFDDVVEALDAVARHDWRHLLMERQTSTTAAPPLAGIERSGWRLSWAPTPSALQSAYDKEAGQIDLTASIGILLKEDGTIEDIVPGKAADRAGVGPGMKLVAVNSRRWSAEVLRAAIAATKPGPAPLELLIENGDYLRPHRLDYHEGEKYPRLEPIPGASDRLSGIIKAAP
ncbi:MAG TPA: M61 family peptidase [Candidatus Polarisedimenticolia bacterium]